MKKLLLIAAAFVAVSVAAPAANAQVNIRAGEHGVGVRVGPGHRPRHASRQLAARSHARSCRVVKTRTVTPRGNVIVKTRRVCR